MTLASIINTINNGDVPTFTDLSVWFDGQDMWNIRNACFGDMNAAIRFCARYEFKWHSSYAGTAMIDTDQTISVNPAHALIIAAMKAYEKKAGRSIAQPPASRSGRNRNLTITR